MNVPDGLPELGTAPAPAPADEPGDGELLGRFARYHDEEAFAVLVRRHGPMVFGVCLRILRDPHDAEDAFQATFLVLARQAGTVGRPELLASWLYGVAYRTAHNARVRAARRHRHEAKAASKSAVVRDPEPEPALAELRTLLDRELQRLPEKYRAPLVLCYLEGKTNEEAARQLGWPSGSMAARLARGRELLRERLRAGGVAYPAVALLALLGQGAAAVPARLYAATVQAALAVAIGKAVLAISPAVLDLMESTLKALTPRRWRVVAVLLAALLLAALGAGAAASTLSQGNPSGACPAPAPEPVPPAPSSQPPGAPPHPGCCHSQPE
jgi:RNA polymerase sigma factor (sigma-70 family)